MNFPKILIGGLWHSTNIERFESIKKYKAVLVKPMISNSERWGTYQGEEHYPYVRHLGGVSLFDFNNFNYEKYHEEYPCSSVDSFVPSQKNWKKTVWLEINRSKCKKYIINSRELVKKWKEENMYGHNLMPYIESAHIGNIPVEAISRILIYDKDLNP